MLARMSRRTDLAMGNHDRRRPVGSYGRERLAADYLIRGKREKFSDAALKGRIVLQQPSKDVYSSG